jgi:cyclic pyranopterin phosphate synthase
MVDVSPKPETAREAVAHAVLRMTPRTLRLVRAGNAPKGDVLGVARTAGIMAAKRTHELIPLCHPLRLTGIDIQFDDDVRRGELRVQARVRTVDKTGVEMEALTAVSVAALAVYDMVKAVEKGVTITRVQLLEKTGGKSGTWKRAGRPGAGRPGAGRSGAGRSGAGRPGVSEPRAPRAGHPRPEPATRPPLQ